MTLFEKNLLPEMFWDTALMLDTLGDLPNGAIIAQPTSQDAMDEAEKGTNWHIDNFDDLLDHGFMFFIIQLKSGKKIMIRRNPDGQTSYFHSEGREISPEEVAELAPGYEAIIGKSRKTQKL